MIKRFCLFCSLIFSIFISPAQNNIERNLMVNGMQRQYIIHLPANNNSGHRLPLVLIFHGGGGNDKQMQHYMGMDSVADKESFITVYPRCINKQWNDGREFRETIAANDDVKFIDELLDTLEKNYPVDSKRVFATGISNGAFFSIYLSYKLSKRFLAIAPVCAAIPQKIYDQFYPSANVSLLLINGTEDPLVPYNGGAIGNQFTGSRGECMSTDKTIERFIEVNKTATTSVIQDLPDKNKTDGCQAI